MNTQTEPRSCPDPQLLAAYFEGTADETTREEIGEHIQECHHCILVLRETSRYERSQAGTTRWKKLMPLAAGFMIAVSLAAVVIRYRNDPVRRLAAAAQQAGVRTFEGRLESFQYGRFTSTRSGSGATPALTAAAQGILDDSAKPSSAKEWHATGVASLLADHMESAVQALSEAVRLEPKSAVYRNDLAAARIALGTSRRDPFELRRALADADYALRLAPRSPHARFNRALALERLGESPSALRAYAEYLAVDPDSPWAEEARWRMSRLRR